MTLSEFKNNLICFAEDETVSIRSIQALITRFFKRKAIPYIQSNESFVTRCRVNKPGEVFKYISELSYPPDHAKESIKLQRANYPQQQVFYCSMPTDSEFASASSTIVLETSKEHIEDTFKPRTYLTLSRWDTIRPLNFWVLPFSQISCEKNKDFALIRQNVTKAIEAMFDSSSEVINALAFISEAFCQIQNKALYYRITSAFYNTLLAFEKLGSQRYDGLMYPSANTEGAGVNLVLKKDLIDNKILSCTTSIMYSMQRLPNNPKSLVIGPASNMSTPESDGRIRFTNIW